MWANAVESGVVVFVKVIPGGSGNAISQPVEGPHQQAYLKVKITQIAEDGKANTALLTFLAQAWRVPVSRMTLISGMRGRYKQIHIVGATLAQITG